MQIVYKCFLLKKYLARKSRSVDGRTPCDVGRIRPELFRAALALHSRSGSRFGLKRGRQFVPFTADRGVDMAEECEDKKCFQHGSIRVRGGVAQGIVISTGGKRTAIIERTISKKLPKYHRWAKVRSHLSAHNPPCINAKAGDMVEIGETRKISKTKAWTITRILQKGEAV